MTSDEQRVKRCSQGTFEALSPPQAARPGVGKIRILMDCFLAHFISFYQILSDFVLKLKSVCFVFMVLIAIAC